MGVSSKRLGRSIVLIGFSGSGKTTLGKMLAKRLRVPFVDLDAMIVASEGRSIADIFSQQGERYFRRVETSSLTELASQVGQRRVLALGGGAFQSVRNRQLSRRLGMVIYLSCSVRELYRRLSHSDDRPLMNAILRSETTSQRVHITRIKQLIALRSPLYRMADITVSTSHGRPEEVVSKVYHKVYAYYASHKS